MEEDIQRCRKMATVRSEQLFYEDLQLRRRLFRVRSLGWPLLFLSLACPIAAGSVSLSGMLPEVDRPHFPILSFVGAVAVALHRGFNCETYHEALKRSTQSIRSIAEEFEAVASAADSEVCAALKIAESRLRDLRANSNDLPPKR